MGERMEGPAGNVGARGSPLPYCKVTHQLVCERPEEVRALFSFATDRRSLGRDASGMPSSSAAIEGVLVCPGLRQRASVGVEPSPHLRQVFIMSSQLWAILGVE